MSRDWTRIAGVPIDAIGFGLLVLLALVGALLVGAAWHFYPRWLPRWSWLNGIRDGATRVRSVRWRFRRRARGRRRERSHVTPARQAAADELPDLPVEEFLSTADRFAAAGLYREAVRERLRAITRQLVDRGLITHHPEWTITELVRAAASRAPAIQSDLQEASRIFSDIWYGDREASRAHDERMRELAARVGTGVAVGASA
jgi:hypothetical protein